MNITSIGGRVAVPHLAPYCASKFALVGLSDAVRAELERSRDPGNDGDTGPDAHRVAGKCGRQREARGRVRVVRDL